MVLSLMYYERTFDHFRLQETTRISPVERRNSTKRCASTASTGGNRPPISPDEDSPVTAR
jgi:hypothetical protein